jgi:hypothetical protein
MGIAAPAGPEDPVLGAMMRVPLEGGGRLVVELNAEEATALGKALEAVVG